MQTKITEIADGIFRLSTFVPQIAPPAGFVFNQFLVVGDEPLLFHTGLRKMFPLTRDGLSRIMPPENLRWISFGHFEADECGALNEWLAVAPQAQAAQGWHGSITPYAWLAGVKGDVGAVVDSPPTAISSHRKIARP